MTHAVPHVFFLDLWLGVDCSCCFDATHSHLHAVRGRLPSYFHFRGWLVLSTMMVQVVCYGIFWEIPSGNVPVFSAIWFDNGYMFASAHEVLSDKGVDMPVVMLDSLVQSSWPGCGCACRCGNDRDMVRQCRMPCWCRSCCSSKVDGLPSCRRWSCLFRLPHRDSAVAVGQVVEAPVVQVVPCPLSCDRCSWFRHCRKLWRCRRCSYFAVVDVAVISQRQVPGKADLIIDKMFKS